MNTTLKYYLYLAAGLLSLSLGVIGIFLPVLPTTPFLLLSSYCFLRSSKRMHLWLTQHKVFGVYIRNYMEHKSIRKKDRIIALVFLWSTLGISMFLSASFHLTAFLVVIGAAVTYHLSSLKTTV